MVAAVLALEKAAAVTAVAMAAAQAKLNLQNRREDPPIFQYGNSEIHLQNMGGFFPAGRNGWFFAYPYPHLQLQN